MNDTYDEQSLNRQPTSTEGAGGAPPQKGRGGVLNGILIGVIVLLALAVIFATPLRDMVLAGKDSLQITLALIHGPEAPEPDGSYRFEVEAKVRGNPAPAVSFNRNDRLGETAENITHIFLELGESFTLVAIAENSLGQASATLELKAPAYEDYIGGYGSGKEEVSGEEKKPGSSLEPGRIDALTREMHELESKAQCIALEFHNLLGELENIIICHTYNDFLAEYERYTGELSLLWKEWSDSVNRGDIPHLDELVEAYRGLVDEFEALLKEAEALKP